MASAVQHPFTEQQIGSLAEALGMNRVSALLLLRSQLAKQKMSHREQANVATCDYDEIEHYATAELDELIEQGMELDDATRAVNARINSRRR